MPPASAEPLSQSLQGYLQSLAARTATPGGGFVAAANAAEAASLLAMVARFSKGEAFSSMAAVLDAASQTLLRLADADSQAFQQVLAVWQGKDESRRREALLAAAKAPAKVIECVRSMEAMAAALCKDGNPQLKSDVAIAADLLATSLRACDINILVNLQALPGEAPPKLTATLKTSRKVALALARIASQIRDQMEA